MVYLLTYCCIVEETRPTSPERWRPPHLSSLALSPLTFLSEESPGNAGEGEVRRSVNIN